MKKRLITELINRKLIKNAHYLTEDRIPSLIKKYSGTKKVPSGVPSIQNILLGKKMDYDEVPILDTSHDANFKRTVGSSFSSDDLTKHIIEKVAEADPSPGKEYTDRMLHWYSKSSDRYSLPQAWSPVGADEETRIKGETINQQMIDKHRKLYDEKHSYVNHFKMEDLGRAADALAIFHKVKHTLPENQKDINKINSLRHLEDIVEQHRFRVSKTQEEKNIKSEGVTKLHEDEDISVYHIKTKEASCMMGANTRWCVSSSRGNAFDSYNSTSPLILFQDKKGKYFGKDKGPNKKFLFHFGMKRDAEVVSEPHVDYHTTKATDHQFMDETDSPISYENFIRHFPQTTKIPQLQHLHSTLFQEEPMHKKMMKVESNPGELDKILNHFETHKELQRSPEVYTEHSEWNTDPKHLYLANLLPVHAVPKKLPDNADPSEKFDISDPGSHDYHIESDTHPIIRHFFGSDKELPKTSKEESNKFFTTINNKNFVPHENTVRRIFRSKWFDPKVNSVSDMVSRIKSNSIHDDAYDLLKSTPHPGDHSFHFLETTQNSNLIKRAYLDAKSGNLEPSSKLPARRASGEELNWHSVEDHISRNVHTPPEVLSDIAHRTSLTGQTKAQSEKGYNPDTQTISRSWGGGRYPTSETRMGREALSNLLFQMEERGGH